MTTLRKHLNSRHIMFLALGSAVGTGFFYGSSAAVKLAGPAVILAYILGGAAVYMVMRSLGEMAVNHPANGSFSHYAHQYLGPMAGFITGWMFVAETIIVGVADVTACGIYMGYWFPDVAQWIWVLLAVMVVCVLNLCHVKVFGELEFWLSLIKILAVVGMIVGGASLIVCGASFHGNLASLSNIWGHGGFFPHGITGVIAALSVVMFAYGGIEVIGMTAAETAEPEKTLPRAIKAVPVRILLFYVMTMVILMSLLPWNEIGTGASPFVQIFSYIGVKAAAGIFNVIVIIAAISAINSDIFGAGRMLYSLSEQGYAPKSLVALSRYGVPWLTTLLAIFALCIGVLLNYMVPERAFFIVASLATFATVWVWLMILFSHCAMRYKMDPEARKHILFPAPCFPVFQYLTIIFMFIVVMVMYYYEETRVSLYAGLGFVGVLLCLYKARFSA